MDKTDNQKGEKDMKCFEIDLYSHFRIPRPEGAAGMLKCCVQLTSPEVSPCRERPAVLVIPGGGYCHVSAREAMPVALRFMGMGYNAFVLRYSVYPCRFPTALREAAMAMRYIRENAAELGIGKDLVAATGFSAGGHLCGTLGMLFDCPEIADIAPPEVVKPNALGLCYPVTVCYEPTHMGSFDALCGRDDALRRRLSLDACVRGDMPPVFLWHTRDDGAVPCVGSLILGQRLAEKNVDFAMHIYRHGQHGLSNCDDQVYRADGVPDTSPDVPGWIEEEIAFFREIGIKSRDI